MSAVKLSNLTLAAHTQRRCCALLCCSCASDQELTVRLRSMPAACWPGCRLDQCLLPCSLPLVTFTLDNQTGLCNTNATLAQPIGSPVGNFVQNFTRNLPHCIPL